MADSLRKFRERRLERETGIEPATNSLEGCDSTTELLPPTARCLTRPSTRQSLSAPALDCCIDLADPAEARESSAFALRAARYRRPAMSETELGLSTRYALSRHHSTWPGRSSRMVGRGGFEPPKAHGRQIYSLLHLTALQPPRHLVFCSASITPTDHPKRREPQRVEGFVRRPARTVELAEGFEPPTR